MGENMKTSKLWQMRERLLTKLRSVKKLEIKRREYHKNYNFTRIKSNGKVYMDSTAPDICPVGNILFHQGKENSKAAEFRRSCWAADRWESMKSFGFWI